jgi:c-di-GMP-binding flagellar brake protein YcgR
MTGQERRLFPRHHAPSALVAVVSFLTRGQENVRVKNISLGGLCFATETDISGESLFRLSLSLAEETGPSLNMSVSAKVAWHIHDDATSLHTVGVKFVEMTEADEQALGDFVNSLESPAE